MCGSDRREQSEVEKETFCCFGAAGQVSYWKRQSREEEILR